MSNHFIRALTVGASLVLAAGSGWAQTSTAVNPPETKIGVTPQDAKEATQKAVPKADTATLVRTQPSSAEKASEMAKDAKKAVTTPAKSNTGDASTTGSSTTGAANTSTTAGAAADNTGARPAASAPSNDGNARRTRPARADRN